MVIPCSPPVCCRKVGNWRKGERNSEPGERPGPAAGAKADVQGASAKHRHSEQGRGREGRGTQRELGVESDRDVYSRAHALPWEGHANVESERTMLGGGHEV